MRRDGSRLYTVLAFLFVTSITVTGSLGILLRAKNSGLIVAIKPLLNAIGATNFRLSEQLVQLVLKQAGE